MQPKEGERDVTPGQTNAETKGNAPAGDANTDNKAEQEKNLDEKIAEKQKQLEQLKTETQNLTSNLRGLRDEKREFKLFEESQPKQVKKTDEDGDDYDDEESSIDRKVEEKLLQRTQQERVRMYNSVAERFIRDNDEFDPDNDVGGELLREFKVRATNTFLGESESQVQETLRFILAGIVSMRTPLQEESDGVSDLGEISSAPTETKVDSEDWNTKTLNKWEKIAAKNYPGGESAYRKARAEIAKKK